MIVAVHALAQLRATINDAQTIERERRMLAGDSTEGTAQERADLAQQVASLVAMADAALQCPMFSVMDKTAVPPSGNKHDYFTVRCCTTCRCVHKRRHESRTMNTNAKRCCAQLTAYVSDGVRSDATRLYGTESNAYDRTRLQNMFQNTTVLALAWAYTRNAAYATHAADLVRASAMPCASARRCLHHADE